MTITKFGKQLDHLLGMGAIEGEEVSKMYHLLQAYKQGLIRDEAVQQAIDLHDPDYVEQWIDNNLPPLFE